MQKSIDVNKLESQVMECYSYFMDNYKDSNLSSLETMLLQLQKGINLLTITNIVNIIERVVQDGRLTKDGDYRQFSVSSVQTTKDNKIVLICHEVIGYDTIDKKFILDNTQSYINFSDIKKVY
jgi:hypothetical protein